MAVEVFRPHGALSGLSTRGIQHSHGERKCEKLAKGKNSRIQGQYRRTRSGRYIVLLKPSIQDDFILLPNDYELFMVIYPPKHPEWKDIGIRLRSYGNAEEIYKKRKGLAAKAGLVFTDGIVTCFHCGGCHGDWGEKDDPVVEHSRWYPECAFVRYAMGNKVVDYISGEHQKHMKMLAKRGQGEANDTDRGMVEAYFNGEDIRFYEAAGIEIGVLFLAARLLPLDAERDDLVASLARLCELELDIDWRTIPRNKDGSCVTLIDLKNHHVADNDPRADVGNTGPSQVSGYAGSSNEPLLLSAVKHPDYVDVSTRLATFDGFPSTNTALLNPARLAQAGFFYTGRNDETICFHCALKLDCWTPTDDPDNEHIKWNPNCEFIRGKLNGGTPALPSQPLTAPVPLRYTDHPITEAHDRVVAEDRESAAAVELTVRVQDFAGWHNRQPGALAPSTKTYTVRHSRPQYAQYAALYRRESSFDTYPETAKGDRERMARAGFFYTGYEDRTTCFQCGNSVCSWEEDDDPLLEHARWFPDCPYVELQLGDETIDAVRNRHRNWIAEQQVTEKAKSDPVTESMLHDLKYSPVVRRILSQGIDSVIMELAIRKRLNSTGLIDVQDEEDMRKALADVISLPGEMKTKEVRKCDTADLSKCVVCKAADRHALFLPCSHLVACRDCAARSTTCPSCGRQKTMMLEVFLA